MSKPPTPRFSPSAAVTAIEFTPARFYQLADMMKIPVEVQAEMDAFHKTLSIEVEQIDGAIINLAKAVNTMTAEARRTTRRQKNPFQDDMSDDDLEEFAHSIDNNNFLRVIYDVYRLIQAGYHGIREAARGVKTTSLFFMGSEKVMDPEASFESLQRFSLQFEMNERPIRHFISGVVTAHLAPNAVTEIGRQAVTVLSSYNDRLLHRHTTEGYRVHGDPVTTDIAISIFENTDASGEIKDGKKPNEISAYSVRKARIMADAITAGLVRDLINDPSLLIATVAKELTQLRDIAAALFNATKPIYERLVEVLGYDLPKVRQMSSDDFDQALIFLRDLDPRNVVYKEPKGLMTADERFDLDFKNDTIAGIVDRLKMKFYDSSALIEYILQRKADLHDYFTNVNSFYVCKVGNGNPFSGEAPGMLTVIPGIKPNVDIDKVIGSGFDQVKEFISSIKESAKWHDLFLATSPSGSADKSNCLLIGPQGCGKSEVLRAVGGDNRGIGIYAQPSDFLTCWKGEAEKNPKRLFEAAIRLQKESRKQVFILIDEVDTILNDDHARGGFGATNLTTEFQQLMDGIVQYPHIAVWAATNHPERIPMPMIRRFNKVAIVGELDGAARTKLLQHFMGFLPIDEGFSEAEWIGLSERLEGAVGDVIRKIADDVWRNKMSEFVRTKPEEAEKLVKVLNAKHQFQLSKFDGDQRRTLQRQLRPHVRVTAKDVRESLELHLSNVAIQAEIATAKETYERAKKMLAGIKRG